VYWYLYASTHQARSRRCSRRQSARIVTTPHLQWKSARRLAPLSRQQSHPRQLVREGHPRLNDVINPLSCLSMKHRVLDSAKVGSCFVLGSYRSAALDLLHVCVQKPCGTSASIVINNRDFCARLELVVVHLIFEFFVIMAMVMVVPVVDHE